MSEFTARDAPYTDLLPRWSEIPTVLLEAELARRQGSPDEKPSCGSKGESNNYNTPLHVAALILILAVSTLACSFPIIVRRFPRLPVPHRFLFIARHFGTGVLIATAFVHLLPTAFISLTDPCLPSFWNDGYPAMAGLIAMMSVLVVVGIEMYFATKGAGHIHGDEFDNFAVEDGDPPRPRHVRRESYRRFSEGVACEHGRSPDIALRNMEETDGLIEARPPSSAIPSPLPRNSSPSAKEEEDDNDSDLDLSDELETSRLSVSLLNGTAKRDHHGDCRDNHRRRPYNPDQTQVDGAPSSSLTAQQHKKQLLQCLLLEAGILFHSIFIGMALSVATGTPFIVLLIAISFHQTFEGFALGARIAAIHFPRGSPQPWLMALAYGTTTPIGQALGLAIHKMYDPASQTGLLTVGTMNAISSGLLLFAGLVELLAEDFLSDESYETLQGRRRIEACAAVVGGATLMALVGAWA